MNQDINILAIETSCDETAAAIVQNGRDLLANVVSSQIKSHERFGGVVPEVASRHHVEQITLVVEQAMNEAGLHWDDITAVAVTKGPGLVGSLLIGITAAKSIAFCHNKPLLGVHHIAGHIYANRLNKEFDFPLLALIVSGGHTELVLMKEHGHYEVIGQTRDDAAGEAYDKVARMLDLPYPGGPHIDRLAKEGKKDLEFPRAWLEKDSFDFSFSGLKSAVINTIHNSKQRGTELDPKDVAMSFQRSVVEVLTEKTYKAAKKYNCKEVIVAGGVAANKGLRTSLNERFKDETISLEYPPIHLCTDNAAMIGANAYILYKQGKYANLSLNAKPSLNLF